MRRRGLSPVRIAALEVVLLPAALDRLRVAAGRDLVQGPDVPQGLVGEQVRRQ